MEPRLETVEVKFVGVDAPIAVDRDVGEDLQKLYAFIEDSRCEFIGDHEEKYLREPGMPLLKVVP